MTFRKFYLHAGQIALSLDLKPSFDSLSDALIEAGMADLLTEIPVVYSKSARSELDTENLDRELLDLATEMLSTLQHSPSGVTLPLPDLPLLNIGLSEERVSNSWAICIADGDEHYRVQGQYEDDSNSWEFYIAQAGEHYRVRGQYYICPLENGNRLPLEKAIAASFMRDRIIDGGWATGLTEAQRQKRLMTTADEIWQARPSLVCCEMGGTVDSAFIDCFAAAMLLTTGADAR